MADHPLDVDIDPVMPEHLMGPLCQNAICMLTTGLPPVNRTHCYAA